MKKVTIVVLSPVVLLLFFLTVAEPRTTDASWVDDGLETSYLNEEPTTEATVGKRYNSTEFTKNKKAPKLPGATDEALVTYALSLLGSPYLYAGMSEEGFDCSGFTTYVFEQSGIAIGRSSSLQAEEGVAVSREEARPGDLVIFTGTNKHDRTPGHVGIVISSPGDTISFVHSSSNGGVKISQVEGSGYDDRFLDLRRVME
ncbi:NlpC/P60 family protein [Pontibacter qinzhouensis]|uniref:NlpC/P60 family protein n=1 Tax=Pontibacter qinzhouensis TaxID=2603253 RepID=A0A5C8KDM4_9BACT|nr:C40 family peptidase [Pontibacter qinzhouensis]TXK52193.1 NlpC/P60 family protein [Pontibacter qinzhouensis]